MYDQELIRTVANAARATLPMIVDDDVPGPAHGLDPTDIEAGRRLVAALVAGGTDDRALAWSAEILELTAKVMTHHRGVFPLDGRQSWSQVSLLFRSVGVAFAEAVGRVPGTATAFEVDVLDVTRSACRSLTSELDHASLRGMIASLDSVLTQLDRLDGQPPFPSGDVERVAIALRPVSEHRPDD